MHRHTQRVYLTTVGRKLYRRFFMEKFIQAFKLMMTFSAMNAATLWKAGNLLYVSESIRSFDVMKQPCKTADNIIRSTFPSHQLPPRCSGFPDCKALR